MAGLALDFSRLGVQLAALKAGARKVAAGLPPQFAGTLRDARGRAARLRDATLQTLDRRPMGAFGAGGDPVTATPAEFDAAHYGALYADTRNLSPEARRAHFIAQGARAGRTGSPSALRAAFVAAIPDAAKVLEIGPFLRPALRGPNVRYFDVLDTAGLVRRAEEIGYRVGHVPHIDYVSPCGDLGIVAETFDTVFSSHCIEHQPDLVAHLGHAARLLRPSGTYHLIVPDKRYCFDHFLPASPIAAVVEAHARRAVRHGLERVIEHRAMITHNEARRHWRGDHEQAGRTNLMPAKTAAAVAEYHAAGDAYIDVHAWQFTPESFRHVMTALHEAGLSPFRVEAVFQTPADRQEFTAILAK